MKNHLQQLTQAALYARVSSDRQDVDLSVAAQLRALRDYARKNGYIVAREYVDEAESETFVNEIVVMPGNALMHCTIPMPDDSPIPGRNAEEVALNGSVLSTMHGGGR